MSRDIFYPIAILIHQNYEYLRIVWNSQNVPKKEKRTKKTKARAVSRNVLAKAAAENRFPKNERTRFFVVLFSSLFALFFVAFHSVPCV